MSDRKFSSQTIRHITWLVLCMSALTQSALVLYLPVLPDIAFALHLSPVVAKQAITFFLIGFGASQLIYGPLSDRYGRKKIVLFGLSLLFLSCCISLCSNTAQTFLWGRAGQGLGCGSLFIGSRSMLRECFSGDALASALSYASMGFAFGLGVTPLMGAYAAHVGGWRADFLLLALGALALAIALQRWLPADIKTAEKHGSLRAFLKHVGSAYRFILTRRAFLIGIIGGACSFSVLIAYNVMTPFFVQHVMGFSAKVYGSLALVLAIAYYSAAWFNRHFVLRWGAERIYFLGSVLIIVAGGLMLITTLWPTPHLMFVMVPMLCATFGQALVFSMSVARLLHHFQVELSGKVSALFGCFQVICAGIFSAGFAWAPDKNLIALAITLIGLGSCCVISQRHLSP